MQQITSFEIPVNNRICCNIFNKMYNQEFYFINISMTMSYRGHLTKLIIWSANLMKLPNVGFITRLKLFGSHVRGFGILDRENKKYIHIFICSHLRLVCLYLKLKRDKWIWHAASKE